MTFTVLDALAVFGAMAEHGRIEMIIVFEAAIGPGCGNLWASEIFNKSGPQKG